MEWFDPINSFIAIIGSIATVLATLIGVWISISKHRKEADRERLELIEGMKNTQVTLTILTEEVKEIQRQNHEQQVDIESAMNFSKSYFRMSLYSSIITALKRGYTTIGEATEITKMYSIYKQHGGNGEIELLFAKFDKLEIMEDDFYETK